MVSSQFPLKREADQVPPLGSTSQCVIIRCRPTDPLSHISRFLPALLTAILTNHLAWVPTVMPNGQPPIKIFLEKHSSKSVDMLAKTHPYNPLWAQLGEL